MVAFLLVVVSVFLAFYFTDRRSKDFDGMFFTSVLMMFLLLSVVVLGVAASHSREETRVLEITEVIELNNGYAVETVMAGGLYLSKQNTTLSYDCQRPKIIQTVSKTYPYLLGVSVVTESQNVLCLTPDPARP